jgi:YegS/Rv2252/BmrU family lipid kinase
MSKHIHVVVNPASGKNEPILNTLNDNFHPAGVTWSVSVTNAYGDAMRQAREAAKSGADIVVSYGGDGTVMEVVNGLMGTGVPMGILPGGTGNVLSIEVGIPQTLAEAAQVIVSKDSTVRQIDVGQCDAASWEESRYFLLRVASGFDAQRINMTSRELRDKYGRMAYFIGALQAVPESKAVRYTFTLDGEDMEVEGFTCLVENAGNMGIPGVSLASDVSISDGLLDVFCVYNLDFNSLTSAIKSITNQPLDPESFQHWQGREVTIASDPPQPVVGDGEKWGETPVTVKVLPGAIGVITQADMS